LKTERCKTSTRCAKVGTFEEGKINTQQKTRGQNASQEVRWIRCTMREGFRGGEKDNTRKSQKSDAGQTGRFARMETSKKGDQSNYIRNCFPRKWKKQLKKTSEKNRSTERKSPTQSPKESRRRWFKIGKGTRGDRARGKKRMRLRRIVLERRPRGKEELAGVKGGES